MRTFSTKADCLCSRSDVSNEQDEAPAMEPLQIVHSLKALLHALTVKVHLLLKHLLNFTRQLQSNRALASDNGTQYSCYWWRDQAPLSRSEDWSLSKDGALSPRSMESDVHDTSSPLQEPRVHMDPPEPRIMP